LGFRPYGLQQTVWPQKTGWSPADRLVPSRPHGEERVTAFASDFSIQFHTGLQCQSLEDQRDSLNEG